jgi:AcrR family transcriptional regulator
MARPVNQARRDELLAQAVDHVCAHGLAGLSLRSLASALQVDASLLTHHFGNKQQMLALVLNGVRDRLRDISAISPGEPLPDALYRVWAWASDPARRELYLLFFEVYALALRAPDEYEPFLDAVVADWLGPLTSAYKGSGHDEGTARARATLAIATLRGLLLDLLTTGDTKRIDQALKHAEKILA